MALLCLYFAFILLLFCLICISINPSLFQSIFLQDNLYNHFFISWNFDQHLSPRFYQTTHLSLSQSTPRRCSPPPTPSSAAASPHSALHPTHVDSTSHTQTVHSFIHHSSFSHSFIRSFTHLSNHTQTNTYTCSFILITHQPLIELFRTFPPLYIIFLIFAKLTESDPTKIYELIPNGRNVKVTKKNVDLYV